MKSNNDRSSNYIDQQAARDRQKPTRRRSRAQADLPEETPRSRKTTPYKRDHHNYDDCFQEELLEDEWFEQNS